MSISKTLDEVIETLEKAQTDGLASEAKPDSPEQAISNPDGFCPKCHKQLKDCDCLKKGDDCGCDETPKRKRLVKGNVQEQAYCKKCRGELGKCECMRKSDSEEICDRCGKPMSKCDCIPLPPQDEKVEKKGLDALIDVLGKLA